MARSVYIKKSEMEAINDLLNLAMTKAEACTDEEFQNDYQIWCEQIGNIEKKYLGKKSN